MKKYALFLGCMIPQRLPSVEIATRKVLERLGVELVDMEGYSCCPDPIIGRYMDRKTALAVSARNLTIAEEKGLDVVVLCNGCFETLWEASEDLRKEEEMNEINKILSKIGRKYKGKSKVKHIVEVLYEDIGVEEIEKAVKKPFKARLAVHYGCHLFREDAGKDIWRKPNQFSELVAASGAEVVKGKADQLCCGFPTSHVDEEYSLKENLLPKLEFYQKEGIEGAVVVCPACNLQMEFGQVSLRKYGKKFSVPVLHLMELLALSFGTPAKELSLGVHRSPVQQLAEKVA